MVNCISTNSECRGDHQWLVYHHSLVLVPPVSALSVIARSWAPLKVLAKFGVIQCSQNFRAACCHCFAPYPCFAACHCCHDPFIARNAQTRQPFTGWSAWILRWALTECCTPCSKSRSLGGSAPCSISPTLSCPGVWFPLCGNGALLCPSSNGFEHLVHFPHLFPTRRLPGRIPMGR